MVRITQAEKTKLLIQSVIEYRETQELPEFFIRIYEDRDMSPYEFTTLNDLVQKETLTRVDMYELLFPYNKTPHGKLLSIYLVGMSYKKNKKA